MVAAVENRTTVTGTVTGRGPHPTVGRWDLVTLAGVETDPVEGYPDLVGRRAAEQGGALVVAVDRSALPAGDATGLRITLVTTLAGPDVIRAVGPLRSSGAV